MLKIIRIIFPGPAGWVMLVPEESIALLGSLPPRPLAGLTAAQIHTVALNHRTYLLQRI